MFSRFCLVSAICDSCCCRSLFSFIRALARFSSKLSTESEEMFFSIALNSASISAMRIWMATLSSSLCSVDSAMPMCSFSVFSTSLFICAVLITALIMASWSTLSSMVGESWQYFLPKSSRLIHRQTIFFLPLTVHVHRRYGVLHSPHTSFSVSAYLLEYLPCSVFVPTCLTFGFPARRASSSCTRPKVAPSMMAG